MTDVEQPNYRTSLWNGLTAAFSAEGEKPFNRTELLGIRQVGSLEKYIAEFRYYVFLCLKWTN